MGPVAPGDLVPPKRVEQGAPSTQLANAGRTEGQATQGTTGAGATRGISIGRKAWVSAVAGFLGSLAASLIFLALDVRPGRSALAILAIIIGVVAGFCIPAALSAWPDLLMGKPGRALRSGGLAGAIGALAMTVVALAIAQFAAAEDVFFSGDFAVGLVAWTAFGLALGMVEGLVWRSAQRTVLGAVGGAVGGVIAYLIGFAIRNDGTFVIVGLLIGLGAGLIQEVAKQAWLRIVGGPNAGAEVIIDKPTVRLGSSEAADVDFGLYRDPAVMPRHLEIRRRGEGYTLVTLPGVTPPLVNGQARQATVTLSHGDRIQIGATVLQFSARSGASE